MQQAHYILSKIFQLFNPSKIFTPSTVNGGRGGECSALLSSFVKTIYIDDLAALKVIP
jgi:hypothetical protein